MDARFVRVSCSWNVRQMDDRQQGATTRSLSNYFHPQFTAFCHSNWAVAWLATMARHRWRGNHRVNRRTHLSPLAHNPTVGIDPVLTGIGAAAASHLICHDNGGGSVANYWRYPRHWRPLIAPIDTGDDQQGQVKSLVDVANTIARGVRVKTIINHRQRIFNIGSRLIIIVPIIAWCGIFISWTFTLSAAMLTIGIVTIA